ncbi:MULTISPECIES: DUF4870 domain-containing protein [unclassified Leucobacter]|uniref:DUF4870 domain-containing protein n=1 Tax=unclassified Leucobacter TaxID=2621730 RepID=UPI0030170C1F
MSTLPPEGQGEQPTGGEPTSIPPTGTPGEPPTAPPAPPAPPAAPAESAPQQHEAPQPPPAPQYAPPQPQYQAPPAAGQAPPPGGYQQPGVGYQQPVSNPLDNITLNYWLSVFFSWIPALIFFLIEKDKGDAKAYAFHRDNLNFSLLRVIVGLVAVIPYIGWIIGGIAALVLFIFHIIAAVKAPEAYRRNEQPPFIFNIPLIK